MPSVSTPIRPVSSDCSSSRYSSSSPFGQQVAGSIARNSVTAEEKGEEQVNQFAQAFRAAGMNEAADEMEIFAKQEGHHGATLQAMIEKYKK